MKLLNPRLTEILNQLKIEPVKKMFKEHRNLCCDKIPPKKHAPSATQKFCQNSKIEPSNNQNIYFKYHLCQKKDN